MTATGDGAASADVEDLKRRAQGWEFELPMTEIHAVLVKVDDLLEEVPS